ncbi:hypothetical protein BGY98DRAFT_319558 [Russula aff. rugulosa BPL654]|nr:hypothetical protein BGY98DRAFT_319558 [Russula aff. rugulosa BPL654]
MNLPIPRTTRAAKELLSGPTPSRSIALLPFGHLLSPRPLIPHLRPAKEGRIHPTLSKSIALLPFGHLLSPQPLIPHLLRPAKEGQIHPTDEGNATKLHANPVNRTASSSVQPSNKPSTPHPPPFSSGEGNATRPHANPVNRTASSSVQPSNKPSPLIPHLRHLMKET